jgi:hypothetical protein
MKLAFPEQRVWGIWNIPAFLQWSNKLTYIGCVAQWHHIRLRIRRSWVQIRSGLKVFREKRLDETDLGSMLWSQFSAIFSQFSAKKLAFFLNTNVMINFFQNLALFWVKNANFFAKIFGQNI